MGENQPQIDEHRENNGQNPNIQTVRRNNVKTRKQTRTILAHIHQCERRNVEIISRDIRIKKSRLRNLKRRFSFLYASNKMASKAT